MGLDLTMLEEAPRVKLLASDRGNGTELIESDQDLIKEASKPEDTPPPLVPEDATGYAGLDLPS
jgi:hypothetical protein